MSKKGKQETPINKGKNSYKKDSVVSYTVQPFSVPHHKRKRKEKYTFPPNLYLSLFFPLHYLLFLICPCCFPFKKKKKKKKEKKEYKDLLLI